jgi:single-strand DNA-binding protein
MASRSLNKVFLIGNLTRDPDVRYTPQGTAVAQFGVATNRDWVTAQGERKEEVQYHRIVAWSKLAELCKQLLTKGSKVFVEGRIVYRKFTGKDGMERQVTEIVVDDMKLLSSRNIQNEHRETEQQTDVQPQETQEAQDLHNESATEPPEEKVDESEIPF